MNVPKTGESLKDFLKNTPNFTQQVSGSSKPCSNCTRKRAEGKTAETPKIETKEYTNSLRDIPIPFNN